MKILLYPLSIIYNLISNLNRKITKPVKLNCPVISIGNITWGGSGKTPIVIELANYILSLNKVPVILSRGYARKDTKQKNVIVRNKKEIVANLSVSGDEPYMMAQTVNCPIIVGSNRVESAKIANQFKPDIFILDDGFQHWKIKRDLDIVCINCLNPFGNEKIIPAGILRENLSSLERANLIILTNSNLIDTETLEELKQKISNITNDTPICSYCQANKITKIKDNKEIDINELKNSTAFTVVSAIGSPENFISTATNLGLNIKNEVIFQDHHIYTLKDISDIAQSFNDNEKILTTAKDAVKIKDIINGTEFEDKIYILNISVNFKEDKGKITNKIKALLNNEDTELPWN
jgi:tetraacyldisaccharide 4'-kinase